MREVESGLGTMARPYTVTSQGQRAQHREGLRSELTAAAGDLEGQPLHPSSQLSDPQISWQTLGVKEKDTKFPKRVVEMRPVYSQYFYSNILHIDP